MLLSFWAAAGDNINALALLHDTPSDVSIVAAAPGGCVVAVLERSELQESLGDAEVILSRCASRTIRCTTHKT